MILRAGAVAESSQSRAGRVPLCAHQLWGWSHQ